MPAYLPLDDKEDLVIHLHDVARMVHKEFNNDLSFELRTIANKLSSLVKEEK